MYFIILIVLSLSSICLIKFLKSNNSSKIAKPPEVESFKKIILPYKPIELNQIVAVIDRLKRRLVRIDVVNSDRHMSKLDDLLNQIEIIYSYARKFCCSYVESNGYFSLIKLFFKTIEKLENEFRNTENNESLEHSLKNLTNLSDFFIVIFKIAHDLADKMNLENKDKLRELKQELLKYPKEFRDLRMFQKIESVQNYSKDDLINNNKVKDTNNNRLSDTHDGQQFNSLPLFCPHQSTICDLIYEGIFHPNTEHKDLFYGEYLLVWIDSKLTLIFKIYIYLFSFLRARLYEYPKLIYDKHFRSHVIKRNFRNITTLFPFVVLDLLDSWVGKLFVNYKTRHTDTESSEFYVPAQNSIEINNSPVDRLKINHSDRINFEVNRKIKCCVMKPKNVDFKNCDKLILFYPGSAFFVSALYFSQIYLKAWTNYCKIPILSVHYRLKRAFPSAHQDCLSVYVWLRKAPVEEVKSKLGFYPKKIVCIGDSAGANLAVGVTLALNDLRTDYKSKFEVGVQMPDGILPICGPYILNPFPCASKIYSLLDVMLSVGMMIEIVRGVTGKIADFRPNTSYETINAFLFPFSGKKSWLNCPRQQFDKKVMLLVKDSNSPYLSPLFYTKFDQLTDIPMHLISAEYCSFLDDSITLAKLYGGPLKVSVLPDLIHAFNALLYENESAYKAAMYCCQQAIELFEQGG